MHDSNALPSNNSNSQGSWLNLPNLGLSVKALFTGYILVVGMGLMMAGAQILLTHGMADGKFGLSVNDIVYSYYGNRGNSRLEAKLNGSMKDKDPLMCAHKSLNGFKKDHQMKNGKVISTLCFNNTVLVATA